MGKSQIGNYLLIIALCVICFFVGKSKVEHKIERVEIEKIKKEIDTVFLEVESIKYVIKEKKEEREILKEKELAIKYDSICDEIVDNLKLQLKNCDETIVYQDRVIEKLDTVILYKDKIIDVKPKPKPFGIGMQVGATTDLKEVKPYIGVGVSYNLIRF